MPDAVIINAPLSLEDTLKAVDNIKNNFQKTRIVLIVPDLSEDLKQEATSYGVNALMEKGIKSIVKLTTASGKTIKTTGEHPYLVKRGAPFVFIDETGIFEADG